MIRTLILLPCADHCVVGLLDPVRHLACILRFISITVVSSVSVARALDLAYM